MGRAENPASLLGAFLRAKDMGAKCVLISGGFDRRGRLPIIGFLEAIKEGKGRTGLIVEVHSGLIRDVERLGEAGVDALLLDFIGDQETIDGYLGGEWSVKDYGVVMKKAKRFIPLVAAHILVGINSGKIKGEFEAVDMAVRAGVDTLSILTLMDTEDTPEFEDIIEVMDYARDRFRGHLTLGCMRAKGKDRPEIERVAVDFGFDGIANPLNRTLNYAESVGVPVEGVEGCCVFIPSKTPRSTKGQEGARQADR